MRRVDPSFSSSLSGIFLSDIVFVSGSTVKESHREKEREAFNSLSLFLKESLTGDLNWEGIPAGRGRGGGGERERESLKSCFVRNAGIDPAELTTRISS